MASFASLLLQPTEQPRLHLAVPFYLPDLIIAELEVVFQLALYILGHENPPGILAPSMAG
jgi:hypothetical protein